MSQQLKQFFMLFNNSNYTLPLKYIPSKGRRFFK